MVVSAVDLEEKVQIYGGDPVDRIKKLKRIYGKNKNKKESRGYLICNTCLGYYKLKENESPEDFNKCECGGSLKYAENIDQRKIIEVSSNEWSLWGLIEEKNIKNDIYKEKMVMDDIIEKENSLLSYIKEKRKNKPLITKSINAYSYGKIIIIILIIAFIGIIIIYALR